ncbi:hypothetical protein Aduo_019315 [Ancylostoma duodenale]
MKYRNEDSTAPLGENVTAWEGLVRHSELPPVCLDNGRMGDKSTEYGFFSVVNPTNAVHFVRSDDRKESPSVMRIRGSHYYPSLM